MRPVLFELRGQPLRCGHPSHSSFAIRHGDDEAHIDDVTAFAPEGQSCPGGASAGEQERSMKFVLVVYQGATPVPGSDRWQALSQAEQKAIYAEYAEVNKTEGLAPGVPLGLPDAARTVQVRDGKMRVKNGTYQAEGAAGFVVYEAESMDAAIALAAKIPAARLGGAVEVRPAEKYW
jgi:hypothetical protein